MATSYGGFGLGTYGKSRFDEQTQPFGNTYATPGWQRAQQRWAKGKATRSTPHFIEGEMVARETDAVKYAKGERVFHEKFGYGVITRGRRQQADHRLRQGRREARDRHSFSGRDRRPETLAPASAARLLKLNRAVSDATATTKKAMVKSIGVSAGLAARTIARPPARRRPAPRPRQRKLLRHGIEAGRIARLVVVDVGIGHGVQRRELQRAQEAADEEQAIAMQIGRGDRSGAP